MEKRFIKKESYLTFNDLMKCTYEYNNMESVRLRIGMVIEKTYDAFSGQYLGCRHLDYQEACELVDFMVQEGDYKKVTA